MEAVRAYVESQKLRDVIHLPDSFIGRKLEITIIPVNEQPSPAEKHAAITALKGPHPNNTLTLDEIRDER